MESKRATDDDRGRSGLRHRAPPSITPTVVQCHRVIHAEHPVNSPMCAAAQGYVCFITHIPAIAWCMAGIPHEILDEPVQPCRSATQDEHRHVALVYACMHTYTIHRIPRVSLNDSRKPGSVASTAHRSVSSRGRAAATGAAGIQQNSSNLDILLHPQSVLCLNRHNASTNKAPVTLKWWCVWTNGVWTLDMQPPFCSTCKVN